MIAEQVRTYLLGEGFTNLFLGFKPESPNALTVVRDMSAPQPPENQIGTEQTGVQVTARDYNQQEARDRCYDIYKRLVEFRTNRFTPTGNHVTLTVTQTPPSYIGTDENGRHEWTFTTSIRYNRQET
jgi:hypothetical protein